MCESPIWKELSSGGGVVPREILWLVVGSYVEKWEGDKDQRGDEWINREISRWCSLTWSPERGNQRSCRHVNVMIYARLKKVVVAVGRWWWIHSLILPFISFPGLFLWCDNNKKLLSLLWELNDMQMITSTDHRKHAAFYDNYSYSEGLLKEINDCDFWFSGKIWVNIFVIIHKYSKYNFMKKHSIWLILFFPFYTAFIELYIY